MRLSTRLYRAARHRHEYTVVRRERNTGHALVKQCDCGRTMRFVRGRWVVSCA